MRKGMRMRRPTLTRYLTRRALVTAGSGLAAGLGIAGAGYATEVEPNHVRTTRYALTPPGWPAGRPLRIALIADTHSNRSNMGETALADVVARTNALDPDLVLLLGDYCSQDPGRLEPEQVAGILSGARGRLGTYAVQGNHDWGDDRAARRAGHGPTRTERALKAAGIDLVEDAVRKVPGAEGLYVAGLASEQSPGPDGRLRRIEDLDASRLAALSRALEPVPPGGRVILMAHEPDIFAAGLDPRVALTVSGHTHGGQVRVMGWSPWIPSRYGNRYAYGHVEERGRHLVVSGGLGSHFVAGRPLRIGVPPEIVLVEVGAAAPATA